MFWTITNLYLWAFIGAASCFYLRFHLGLSPVVASALTGLIFSFTPKMKFYDHLDARAIVYAASFAAMAAPSLISEIYDIAFLSILVAASYSFSKPYFLGYGGKLGSIAFISCVVFWIGRIV